MRLSAPAAALALLAVAGCSRAANPTPPELTPAADRAWVELTDRGAEARLVTVAGVCPVVTVDGKPAPMTRRAAPSADFPMTVCQAPLPKTARTASVRGIALPLPAAAPKR